MIRYKEKEFTQYSICPATGEIFDVKTGVVQPVKICDNRPCFKGMLVHRIMAHTFFGYKPGLVVHHKDENPLNNSLSNLVYLSKSEHISLHHKGKEFSEEHKVKLSTVHKGKPKSEEAIAKMSAALKGKPRSDETRTKISLAQKGRKRGPLSEETKIKLKAFLWWTNGTEIIRSKECPGEGWKKGRLKTGA